MLSKGTNSNENYNKEREKRETSGERERERDVGRSGGSCDRKRGFWGLIYL